MKGCSEFKGYRAETAYDNETGQFVRSRIPHAGFEAMAGTCKPAHAIPRPAKTEPPATAAERLALLKQRIAACRAPAPSRRGPVHNPEFRTRLEREFRRPPVGREFCAGSPKTDSRCQTAEAPKRARKKPGISV